MTDHAPNDADASDRIEIWTVAPFTVDINFYSLTKTKEDFTAFQNVLAADGILTQTFHVEAIGWPFGYGTVEHDDIPLFFQPAARLRLRDDVLTGRFWGPGGRAAKSSEVHIYDDGIAILLTQWDAAPDDLRRTGFDRTLTDATVALFAALLRPRLQDLSAVRARLPGVLRDHDEYLVTREGNEIADAPIWVARSVLVTGKAADDTDLSWISGVPDTPCMAGPMAMFVGSGNCVFTDRSGTGAQLRQTWIRTMSMSQFYSVTLQRFQSGLLSELRTLSLGGKGRKRKKIVETIVQKLDHLEFFRLQHERAVYGLQGRRRQMYAHIYETWNGDAHLRNAIGWAEFLRQKIARYYASRRILQSRMLKGMIAAIGGFTLFDLAVVLLGASETYKDDQVYGLLDILRGTPADTLLMVTGGFLLIVAVIAFMEDRG